MSLETRYDAQNVFAKIIAGEIPCVKIWEDDDVMSFMDLFPQAVGHALVIPKRGSAVNLLDVDAHMLSQTIAGVQKTARAVRTALKPDGVRIAQFNGAAAGQTVFHIHFHIIPVYENGNAPERPHAAGAQADPAALAVIADSIRAAL